MSSRARVFVATFASSIALFGCTAPLGGEEAIATSSAALSASSQCPGTDWVLPDTWDGIAGGYTRSTTAPRGELSFLEVLASPTRPGAEVPEVRIVDGVAQFGQLVPVESNPLVGSLLFFYDTTGTKLVDVYAAPFIVRDPLTKNVTRICAVYEDGKPFVLTRLGI